MALALSTNPRDGAGPGSTASPSLAPSSFAPLDTHQRGRTSNRALSHGHPAHVRVHMNPEDQSQLSDLSISVVTHLLLRTGAGFGRRPFQPHSHRLAVPSRSSRKQAVGSSRLVACAYSMRVVACKRSRANPLAHQQLIHVLADASHIHAVLSSSLFSSGIDPNENGLTDGTERLSPRGKTYD